MAGVVSRHWHGCRRRVQLPKLPIDAVPDITNVQVQINTQAPGYSPLETEQRVTYPIETVMAGLPNLEQTRSLSRYGLSQVTVIFKDGTDIYFARQLVNERIQEARDKLPPGITPAMGPISTGLGRDLPLDSRGQGRREKTDGMPYTATDLREIQDWIIKPQLRNVPGVTEINSIGGFAKEYQISPIPERLTPRWASPCRHRDGTGSQQRQRGCGLYRKRGEQYLIRAPGQSRPWRTLATLSSAARAACRYGCVTWRTWGWGVNCAPARPRTTAARWCWALSSCSSVRTAARFRKPWTRRWWRSTAACPRACMR